MLAAPPFEARRNEASGLKLPLSPRRARGWGKRGGAKIARPSHRRWHRIKVIADVARRPITRASHRPQSAAVVVDSADRGRCSPAPDHFLGPAGCDALLTAANGEAERDRKSTRLNSSHGYISYAVFCLKKKKSRADTHRRAR